jgi:hypothetical protein
MISSFSLSLSLSLSFALSRRMSIQGLILSFFCSESALRAVDMNDVELNGQKIQVALVQDSNKQQDR